MGCCVFQQSKLQPSRKFLALWGPAQLELFVRGQLSAISIDLMKTDAEQGGQDVLIATRAKLMSVWGEINEQMGRLEDKSPRPVHYLRYSSPYMLIVASQLHSDWSQRAAFRLYQAKNPSCVLCQKLSPRACLEALYVLQW